MISVYFCVNSESNLCSVRHKSLEAARRHKFPMKACIKALRNGEFTTVVRSQAKDSTKTLEDALLLIQETEDLTGLVAALNRVKNWELSFSESEDVREEAVKVFSCRVESLLKAE